MLTDNLRPALYMLPVGLSEVSPEKALPAYNMEVMRSLRHFIVENVRTARRFLRACMCDFPIDECSFVELNGHTDPSAIPSFLQPLRDGHPMGLMSEAGCPGIADPGADVVAIAQREKLKVIPLVGPSSILMSLMASGFNGQGFAFCGYLPVKPDERTKAIKELENRARRSGQTQIFIETPYRNNALLHSLATTLAADTMLCVAADITAPDEYIATRKAAAWKTDIPDLNKRPAIFLIHRQR